jgi:hypothetical protein
VLQSYYDEIAVDDYETDHEEKELTPVQASEDRSSLLMADKVSSAMSPPHLSYLKFGTKVLHTSPD